MEALLDFENKTREELKNFINEKGFVWACVNGHLKVAKWLLSVKPDINVSAYNKYAFIGSCENNHMEVAEWVISLIILYDKNAFIDLCINGELKLAQEFYSINPEIDISGDNEHIFKIVCEHGQLEVAKWLLSIKPDINISIDDDYIFKLVCEKEHLNMAKWLYNHLQKTIRILPPTFRTACVFNNLKIAKIIYLIEPYIDISEDDEYIFRTVCKHGYLDMAKWLLSIKPDIDISIKDEYAFRWACCGHLEVAKWLISIKPDINIDAFHNDDDNEEYADWHDNMDDYEYAEMFDDERNKTAFIKVCESNNLEIAQWLCKLNKKYHIEFKNDNIINYYVS